MDWGVGLSIAGIVVGAIGLATAIPPFLQMRFGRPEFELGTDEFTGPDGKSLFITLRNRITGSRFLKIVGVSRETGEVDATFSIRQQGTNLLIAHLVSGSLHNAALRESGLMAKAFPGRTIGLTVVHIHDGTAHIMDARADNPSVIPTGDYAVDAAFICGERVVRISKNLRVGQNAQSTFWY